MEQSENTAAEEIGEEAGAEAEEQQEAKLPPTSGYAETRAEEPQLEEEAAAEEEEEDETDDPILVLQLLQINDREYFAAIKKLQEQIEETKDELNTVVEEVFELNSGISGFVRKALLGSNVPPNYARLLESIQHKINVLEAQRAFMAEHLELARQLAADAETAPDSQNTNVLRKRAIHELKQLPDEHPLIEANRRVEMFRKLLTEETELEELEEEEPIEEEALDDASEKRGLGNLAAHFEEYKEQKAVELKHKILETDIGKKGLRRLEALADKLEQKREEKYAAIRKLSAAPQGTAAGKE